MSAKRVRHAKPKTCRASLEDLEPRLLMTTLSEGQFFVYQNTQGECVRIDLHETGSSGLVPQVELFAYDDQYTDPIYGKFPGLVDLPGLMNGSTATSDQIMWPDNLPIIVPGTSPTWAVYNATAPAPGVMPTETLRGAMTEIYAIYVSAADSNTVLTISTLVAKQPGSGWTDDAETFSSTTIPLLAYPDDNVLFKSPANSGGVIVGAKADPSAGNPAAVPPVAPNPVRRCRRDRRPC